MERRTRRAPGWISAGEFGNAPGGAAISSYRCGSCFTVANLHAKPLGTATAATRSAKPEVQLHYAVEWKAAGIAGRSIPSLSTA